MSRILQVAAVAGAALILAGCDDWGDWGGNSDRYREDFHQTQTLKPGGRVSVETMNGSVEIVGHDSDTVDISGTKFARSQDLLQSVRIDVVASADAVRIRTVGPSGIRGGHGARYVIRVPRRVELDRIESSNGRVSIDGIEGNARVRTSNGSVKAARLRGDIEARTSNASVELSGLAGSAVVYTSNGAVRAEEVRGYLQAETSNASINARLVDPQAGRPVKLETSNGSITLAMDAFRDNAIYATTSNASVTLRLPPAVKGVVRAKTSNGNITTDYDLNVRGTQSKNNMEGTIGAGGPPIELATSNGSIKILRF